MKKLIVLAIVLFLAACGGEKESDEKVGKEPVKNETSETTTDTSANTTEEVVEEPEETIEEPEDGKLTKVGQTIKDSDYSVELLKIKNLNESIEHGPITINMVDAKLIRMFDISSSQKDYLQQFSSEEIGDEITYLQLGYNVKNDSDKDITWDMLRNIVVDGKTQIEGVNEDIMAYQFNYDLYAGVEMDYGNGYIMPNSDVDSFRLIFGPVYEMDAYDELSEKVEYEFSFEE